MIRDSRQPAFDCFCFCFFVFVFVLFCFCFFLLFFLFLFLLLRVSVEQGLPQGYKKFIVLRLGSRHQASKHVFLGFHVVESHDVRMNIQHILPLRGTCLVNGTTISQQSFP